MKKIKYTPSKKAMLSDLDNIMGMRIKVNNSRDGYTFIVILKSSTEVHVTFEMFKLIAPLLHDYIPGQSVSAYLYKFLSMRRDVLRVLEKRAQLKVETGDEEYITTLDEKEEYLLNSLSRVEKEIVEEMNIHENFKIHRVLLT